MTLSKDLEVDFKNALKEKNESELSVLRMLKASIEKEQIAGKGKKLSDEDIQKIIKTEIKRRKEAGEAFGLGGRGELAKKEEEEQRVLEKYLPEQMSEADIKKVVEKIISNTEISGPQDMGKVMGSVMKELQGKADGTLVNKIVKESLNK